MRAGMIAAMVAMILILAGVIFNAYVGLTAPGEPMPAQGYAAMIIGIVLSLVVGIGLMALLFYSSRRGYDEPPRLEDQ
jgi:hypothetical protein